MVIHVVYFCGYMLATMHVIGAGSLRGSRLLSHFAYEYLTGGGGGGSGVGGEGWGGAG